MTSPDTLLTLEEVAKALQVSVRSVRRYIDSGQLKATRVGTRLLRVRPSDLEAFLSSDKSA
jgi:excisionase family DNA binding protein